MKLSSHRHHGTFRDSSSADGRRPPPSLTSSLARTRPRAREPGPGVAARHNVAEITGTGGERPSCAPTAGSSKSRLKSLHLNELRSRLEAACGLEFPVTLFFHARFRSAPSPMPCLASKRNRRRIRNESAASAPAPEPARAADLRHARAPPKIAVVGHGVPIPGGADDPASFWRLLRDGPLRDRRTSGQAASTSASLYDPDPDRPGRMCTCGRAASSTDGRRLRRGVLQDLAA